MALSNPFLPPAVANSFNTLNPDLKENYPTPSKRRKRFSKIRDIIDKQNDNASVYPTKTRQFSTPTT